MNGHAAVRYTLSKRDIARGYVYGWRYSPAFRMQMLVVAAGLFAFSMLSTWLRRRSLDGDDLAIGAIWAGGVVLLMPAVLALVANADERVLQLTPDGITTTIGGRSGTLPWSKIAFVHDAGSFVLIGGNTIKTFVVPGRAFADARARERFVEDARAWASAPGRAS